MHGAASRTSLGDRQRERRKRRSGEVQRMAGETGANIVKQSSQTGRSGGKSWKHEEAEGERRRAVGKNQCGQISGREKEVMREG